MLEFNNNSFIRVIFLYIYYGIYIMGLSILFISLDINLYQF